MRIALAKRKYQKNYKEKKKTDSGEIRIYDEKHVENRWKQKVEKINRLEKDIKKVRDKYKKDLGSEDPKVRAIAAIVGLIDNTAMRVGNDGSVDEYGTFGATTLKKEHAKIKGNKIEFKFKGKKGVEQNVVLDDASTVKEIKSLLKDKKAKDFIFAYDEDKRIRAKVVNRYLADFDITAKDIRGFHANHLMKEKLKKEKDWDKALEWVADEVGHEAKTLMNQYLDPALVKKHVKTAFDLGSFVPGLIDKAVNIIMDDEPEVKEVKPEETKDPKITSPYGMRKHPITGKHSYHNGIDLRAPEGTPILSFTDGRVVKVGNNSISGKFIVIDHGEGVVSSYAHLSKVLVGVGDIVYQGKQIGLSGSTGRSTGSHLHFRLKYKGKDVDPAPFISKYRVVG